jgi:hypothetical protein
MKNKNHSLVLVGVIVVGVILLYVAYSFWLNRTPETVPGLLHNQLVHSSDEYVLARESAARGDLEAARSFMHLALINAGTPLERGRILFQTALIEENLVERVKLLQQLVADPSFNSVQKAFAVEEMARTYFNFGRQGKVFEQIFAVDPYAKMRVGGDSETSLLRLYEYSSSFHPLALSQYSMVRYLGERVPEGADIKTSIREHMQLGDAHLAVMEENQGSTGYLWSDVYQARGNALAVIEKLGISEFGTAGEWYAKASSTDIRFRSDAP